MKIRNGFVSNSSSSSFCIFGATFKPEELQKAFNVSDDDADCVDYGDFLPGFSCRCPYSVYDGGGEYYVGIPWRSIKDDETGLQFKQRIQSELSKVFAKEVKCSTLEVAWYDG